jgi:hypothetical protein
MDEAARQLGLVHKALCSGLSNAIHWKNESLRQRVRSDANLQGLGLNAIVGLLVEWVRDQGGGICQRRETRERWRDEQDYVYEVLIPVSGFPRELFVELVLHDPIDEEDPEVVIVSCHLTSFPRGQR